jgi:chromosome segregation protein
VERLPAVDAISPEVESALKEQRLRLRRLGSVNPEAEKEFHQVKERFENMQAQIADLTEAESDLQEVIAELDLLMEKEFRATFEVVASEFKLIFSRLFNGGDARLLLTEEEDLTNTGIDIEARLPGKRAQRLALLSGGERSLTAAALVFALLKASPTPFCVMDEVDAMLDEANVGRFTELLREMSADTQFVVITHNRNTVQAADVIYGVTMGRDTASQVISLRLDEVDERYSARA